MKKKIYILLSIVLLIACIWGCGKEETDPRVEDLAEEMDISVEEAEAFLETFSDESVIQPSNTKEDSSAPKSVDYEHFDADPSWSNYSALNHVVQVDDTLYVPGISVEETITQIEESSIDYTYEYNPDLLLSPGDSSDLEVYRDNMLWFTLEISNSGNENRHLFEAPIEHINVSDVANEYTHVIDGRSYTDIIGISYDEVLELSGSIFSEFELDESDKDETIYLTYSHPDFMYNDTAILKNAYWTGYELRTCAPCTFSIDKNTSKVIAYSDGSIFFNTVWRENFTIASYIESFDEMTQENIDEINTFIIEDLITTYPEYVSAKPIGSIIIASGMNPDNPEYNNYCFIFEGLLDDNTTVYFPAYVSGLGINYNNEFDYSKHVNFGRRKDTLEEALPSLEQDEIIDSTIDFNFTN